MTIFFVSVYLSTATFVDNFPYHRLYTTIQQIVNKNFLNYIQTNVLFVEGIPFSLRILLPVKQKLTNAQTKYEFEIRKLYCK